jgi:heat shock protein HslJ
MRHRIALASCALLTACSAPAPFEPSTTAPASAPAAHDPAFDPALIGSIWLVEDIGGAGVIDNLQSKLQFVSASQVAEHGGCNSFNGAAVLSAEQLSMGPLASTRKMCPPAVMDQENRFLRTLETVRSARVEHDLLYLQDANGQTVLRLSRTP